MTVVLFCRIGLETNLEDTNDMVCTSDFIWGMWGDQDYKRQATGEGATFRERKRIWVSCTKCGVTVTSSYLKQNISCLYDIYIPQTRGVDEEDMWQYQTSAQG